MIKNRKRFFLYLKESDVFMLKGKEYNTGLFDER